MSDAEHCHLLGLLFVIPPISISFGFWGFFRSWAGSDHCHLLLHYLFDIVQSLLASQNELRNVSRGALEDEISF